MPEKIAESKSPYLIYKIDMLSVEITWSTYAVFWNNKSFINKHFPWRKSWTLMFLSINFPWWWGIFPNDMQWNFRFSFPNSLRRMRNFLFNFKRYSLLKRISPCTVSVASPCISPFWNYVCLIIHSG